MPRSGGRQAIGRNDPCHCGSGRKYKRCHLADDEARARELAVAQLTEEYDRLAERQPLDISLSLPVMPPAPPSLQPPPPPPPSPPDPEAAAENEAFWKAFDEAGFEGQVTIFDQQLASGELDEDRAFDMLDTLHSGAVEHGERETFRRLVEAMRVSAPSVYRRCRIWCVSWLIEDAVAEARYERLPELTDLLADAALDFMEETFRLIDILLFHGQDEALIGMMTRLWPSISTSGELVPEAVGEFSTTLMLLLICRHLERGGPPSYDDPALRADLEPLHQWQPLDDARTRRLIAAAAGAGPAWTPADFSRQGKSEDDLWENVMLLGVDWCGWLRRERGVPLARAELARATYTDYVVELPTGKHGHIDLLPPGREIERRLASLTSFLSGQYYKAGTLYALLPAFADFLALRGLVPAESVRRCLRDLRRMRDDVLRIVSDATHDPALIAAVQQVGEERPIAVS